MVRQWQVSPGFLLSITRNSRSSFLHCLRTRPSSTGTGSNWDSRLPKTSYCCVTLLPEPAWLPPGQPRSAHRDEQQFLAPETQGNKARLDLPCTLTGTQLTPSQQLHISSSIRKLLNGIMCFTAGSLWYKYPITKLAIFLQEMSTINVGEGNAILIY